MYFCDNYLLAVLFCVVTMLCWGSWGNTQGEGGSDPGAVVCPVRGSEV